MTRPIFYSVLSAFVCLVSVFASGQGATCGTAVSLPVNTTCTNQGFTNNDNGIGAEYVSTCATTGSSYSDVWYSLTGTGNSITVTISGANQAYTLTAMTNCTGGQLACTQQASGVSGSVTFASTSGVTYYIHIQRRSGNNNADMSGNICAVSVPPSVCASDLTVNTTLYSNTGLTTCGFGDDFSSTDACGSVYMNGDDYVIAYTPTASQCMQFSLSNTGTWVGIFLTDNCPDAIGTTCLASGTNSGGNPSMTYSVTAGTTYYITVSTYPAPQCTPFDINIIACPPPPPNDDCSNAIALTVNPNNLCGITTSGTVQNATISSQANGCFGTADDDVWYSFVATGPVHTVNLLNVTGSTTDLYHSVYSGTCGSIGAALVCSDPNSSSITGLTAGNTYYVRVYSYTSTAGQTTTFDICIGTPPPPPPNDECAGAIGVTVNPDNLCGSTTTGSVASATTSSQANGCFGTANDDVWYSFVATGPVHTIDLLNVTGGTTDLYHSVYSGTCGSLGTALVCSDPNSSIISGLTAGNTYFVRIYSYTSTAGQTTVFDLCVGTPPPPPANDDCTGAIGVTVNPDNLCGSTTTGSIMSATPSSQANGCFGTANDDVWYSFVATSTSHIIDLLNISGGTTDLYHSVYAGNCGSLGAALVCSDPNTSVVSGLTIGNTYYVRIFSYTSTVGQTSVFDLCIGTPPPPPANDECGGAISVPVSSGSCTPVTASVYSATTSPQTNGCFGTANDDVWFTFTATSTDVQIDISNVFGSTTDLYHSVYAGTCGALGAELVCSDPNTSTVNSLTIGNVYFVRVYSYTSSAGQTTTFDLCISEIGPCGTTSVTEDFCPYAAILTQGVGNFASSTYPYYTADLPGNINSLFCGSIENNSWYQFTASNTTEVFDITSVTNCINSNGIQAEVFEVTYDANGCCTAFTSMSNCFNPMTQSAGTITATGLTVGNNYMLMFDGYAGDNCDFVVSNWTAVGIILPVELVQFEGISLPRENVLTWKTVTEQESDYFNVLRSFDGINFSSIGSVNAAGESTELLSYAFVDSDVKTGTVYYKLEQFDFDGNKNTSKIISLNRTSDQGGILAARPNPTESILFVEINPNKYHDSPFVQLLDSRGLIVRENDLVPGELNVINMNLADLSSGVYFLMFTGNDGVIYSKKVLKN